MTKVTSCFGHSQAEIIHFMSLIWVSVLLKCLKVTLLPGTEHWRWSYTWGEQETSWNTTDLYTFLLLYSGIAQEFFIADFPMVLPNKEIILFILHYPS